MSCCPPFVRGHVRHRAVGDRCGPSLHSNIRDHEGWPYNSTQSLMTYMYQQAFSNFAFGYAAALASLLAVVLFGFSALEIRILRSQDL